MLHLIWASVFLVIAIGAFFMTVRFDFGTDSGFFLGSGVVAGLIAQWLMRDKVARPMAAALNNWLPEPTSMLHGISVVIVLAFCLIPYYAVLFGVAAGLERMTSANSAPSARE